LIAVVVLPSRGPALVRSMAFCCGPRAESVSAVRTPRYASEIVLFG
jgi:hypothetical protein